MKKKHETLFRLQMIEQLEEAGESKAASALIKLWQFDHLNLPGRDRLERTRFEIEVNRQTILDADIRAYLKAYAISWLVVLGADYGEESAKLSDIALHFSFSDYCSLAWDFKTLYEEFEGRWKAVKEEKED